jgi:hypothetical protein
MKVMKLKLSLIGILLTAWTVQVDAAINCQEVPKIDIHVSFIDLNV